MSRIREKLVTNEQVNERTNGRTGRTEFIGLILPTRVGWGGWVTKLHSIFVLQGPIRKLCASFKWLQSTIYLLGKPSYEWIFMIFQGFFSVIQSTSVTNLRQQWLKLSFSQVKTTEMIPINTNVNPKTLSFIGSFLYETDLRFRKFSLAKFTVIWAPMYYTLIQNIHIPHAAFFCDFLILLLPLPILGL